MSDDEKKKILVAVDFSESSERALAKAVELAKALDAHVTILHVYDPNVNLYDPEGHRDTVRANLRAALEHLGQRFDGVPIQTALEEGRPSDQIVGFAVRWKYTLVVMGSHGHGGAVRALLGGVVQRVVRTSPVPVLTVPLPTEE